MDSVAGTQYLRHVAQAPGSSLQMLVDEWVPAGLQLNSSGMVLVELKLRPYGVKLTELQLEYADVMPVELQLEPSGVMAAKLQPRSAVVVQVVSQLESFGVMPVELQPRSAVVVPMKPQQEFAGALLLSGSVRTVRAAAADTT